MTVAYFTFHMLNTSMCPHYVTGDDRNIVEVYVAGKQVVPFPDLSHFSRTLLNPDHRQP